MKKLISLLSLSFAFLFTLSAQITQIEANLIVMERLSNEAKYYIIYAQDSVTTEGYTITTSLEEMLELDYLCWIYYINYPDEPNGKYLIVKESNGSLLEVNTNNDEGPEDLEEWMIVAIPLVIPFENFSLQGTSCYPAVWFVFDSLIVIRSYEEFENYFNCTNSLPEIDFSEYTLLMVRVKSVSQEFVNIGIDFFQTNVSQYVLFLDVEMSIIGFPYVVRVLVPKIAEEETVLLNIYYH